MPVAGHKASNDTHTLADAYGEAWNAHDVDALLALQTEDMAFHLHVEGSHPTTGPEALGDLYTFFFTAMPDYHAEIHRELAAEEFFVWEYTIFATLAEAFPIGDTAGRPAGEQARFEAVDVITAIEGKVATKDTYLDGFALWRGMNFEAQR